VEATRQSPDSTSRFDADNPPSGTSTGGGNAEAILNSIEPPAHLLRPELTDNALAVLERRYLRKDVHWHWRRSSTG